MAELKTKATHASIDQFLQGIKDQEKREDLDQVVELMSKATAK